VDVAGFTPPGINFDIDIDQLDIDRYMPPTAGGKSAGGQKPPEQPFDLSGLKNLRANGTLRIGSLRASGVKASNVRLDIKSNGGRVDVSPLAANLYQGTLNGALAINAAPATPTFAVRQNLNGVSIGPAAQGSGRQGHTGRSRQCRAGCDDPGQHGCGAEESLNGRTAVKLADGALKGIDIAGSIRNAKARLGTLKGEQTQQATRSRRPISPN